MNRFLYAFFTWATFSNNLVGIGAFSTQSLKVTYLPPVSVAQRSTRVRNYSQLHAEQTGNTFPEINVVKIDPKTYGTENDQVMDVASYRNGRVSPAQMIAAQQTKRDSFDPVKSALEGIKIGLGIGAAAGIGMAVNSGSANTLQDQVFIGLKNFVIFGGVTSCLLGFNNYTGNRVYVMDMKEATNRLTVDFVASLKISQDIGFAAYLEPKYALTFKNGRFDGCNGLVGTVDCQLRNSKFNVPLENGVIPKSYPEIAKPHLHVKNMDVDETLRRRGIAKKLLNALEEWAKEETDAQLLTLEVRNDNEVAMNLYKGFGFEKDTKTKRKTRAGCSFMVKTL